MEGPVKKSGSGLVFVAGVVTGAFGVVFLAWLLNSDAVTSPREKASAWTDKASAEYKGPGMGRFS